ncbi:MAG: CatB-related O-acetyltransferase [Bacteroidales bacterium]|jgi:acetyltransferase-like isoleucine patch superfamily enzyme
MISIISILKELTIRFKQFVKIYGIYPYKYPQSDIKTYVLNEKIIGKGLIIRPGVRLSNDLKRIGDYTYVGNNTLIMNCEEIGRFCSISHDVKIGLDNHALDHIGTSPVFYFELRGWVKKDTFKKSNPVVIGHDVLISANVSVLSGIKIGTGAVIGANSFVNKDIPPYAIVGGVPAKIIKYRFDEETIDKLLKSKWWLKDKDELILYQDYFNKPNVLLKML